MSQGSGAHRYVKLQCCAIEVGAAVDVTESNKLKLHITIYGVPGLGPYYSLIGNKR